MLRLAQPPAATFDFVALREAEFARLDAAGLAYLDFAAAALHGASQARAHAARLEHGIYGNPHSEHGASRLSADAIAAARADALAWFDADPELYDIVFTANTSAAIKLVAEAYPFAPHRGLVLAADNHNSVNGMREYAGRAGATVAILPLDAELRLDQPGERLSEIVERQGGGLLAFPQQSNFSGVRHDLDLVGAAQSLGCDVLIDAASAGPCGGLSLRRHPAQFVASSFYKLFGLPTGLGLLVARKTALARLIRPWFAGGTVEFVSVANQLHSLHRGHAGYEDGTPNFLDLAAVEAGFDFLQAIPRQPLHAQIGALTDYFLRHVASLAHGDGAPLVRLYGPRNVEGRGGTIAFNILDPDGRVLPYRNVELRAREQDVAIRGGCFCNPGAAEAAFGFGGVDASACLERLRGRFDVDAFRNCLGGDVAVGALRLSIGVPTLERDLDRALALIAGYADSAISSIQAGSSASLSSRR